MKWLIVTVNDELLEVTEMYDEHGNKTSLASEAEAVIFKDHSGFPRSIEVWKGSVHTVQ